MRQVGCLVLSLIFFNSGAALSEVRTCDDVLYSELKLTEELGTGGQAAVFAAIYKKKDVVLRYLNSINPYKHNYYSKFTSAEKADLAAMDLAAAARIIRQTAGESRHIANFVKLSSLEKTRYEIAQTIFNYHLSIHLRGLTYQGHPVVPIVHALVRNDDRVVVGQMVEYIPGDTLHFLYESSVLSRDQILSVYDQVISQINLLDANGFAHGDALPCNIMVEIRPDQKVVARLIDFFSRDGQGKTVSELNIESIRDLEIERARMFKDFDDAAVRRALLGRQSSINPPAIFSSVRR